MISWCVAHTQSLKENLAKHHLLEQGFEVYLPRFKKLRRHARKVEEVLVPLFPRYLFVGMDFETARWHSVNGTRGVSHLLMANPQTPARVPSRIVEALKSQEISEGVVPLESLVSFLKGDKLRILEGGLKDQIVVFEALGDKGRIQVLMNLLGRDVEFSLPFYAVEVA